MSLAGPVASQVAGGITTQEMVESTQMAMGWSVKKTLLGKNIYNETGQKVGKVDDLIIAPDRNVSYVIVGAGGFIGYGRHDVAIPVSRIEERQGRLIMAGATKDSIKAMPEFQYVSDAAGRDRMVAAAEKDMAAGRAKVEELERKSSSATAEARLRIAQQSADVQADVQAVEARLSDMKKAGAMRWKSFETGVSDATVRLRRSIDAATG
ncbi:PRC-barrel domain-containing protein [uncultured Hydrogenophaga sp.]|uniref:PRC-barrel domain-containing protein n=1 Tax=uncultured Hydrogenophaga sp. TaxID=199683 RepID=UPI00265F92BE|nr:PRC-barrel domain-containing protein [uncultured Hydrogenophaga sp.]